MTLSEEFTIAEPIVKEIRNRIGFMQGVGLEYFAGPQDRDVVRRRGKRSAGDAGGLGPGRRVLPLDEPTIGLQRDNDRLIATRHRADIGNTVIVVEHDEDMIRPPTTSSTSVWPGVHGGRIVGVGTPTTRHQRHADRHLSGEMRTRSPKNAARSARRRRSSKGARQNNLGIDDVPARGRASRA